VKIPDLQLLDLTLPSPEGNLALDEYLLHDCEHNNGPQVLRFWEPTQYFVVLGRSKKVEKEVVIANCQRDNIPIYRRISGGGTVLQGPGCLNFSLILHQDHPELKHIQSTNQSIMQAHAEALSPLFPSIQVQGITDLAIENLKCSGNAQRRLKRSLLFHGVFLCQFDLSKIEKYLTIPVQQPAYRENREHLDFLRQLKCSTAEIKASIQVYWAPKKSCPPISEKDIGTIMEKYQFL